MIVICSRTHTHTQLAAHTRSSWHLPFTKHRRFLQQKKYQKRANCGLRCHSQRSCSCQKHENRFLLTLLAPPPTPKSPRAPGFCTNSYYNKTHPRKGARPFSSNMHPHNQRPYRWLIPGTVRAGNSLHSGPTPYYNLGRVLTL